MADCSAVGTTIDRAARAVLGVAAHQEKHAGALLRHAGMLAGQQQQHGGTTMPISAPEHLTLPGIASRPASTITSSGDIQPLGFEHDIPQLIYPPPHQHPQHMHQMMVPTNHHQLSIMNQNAMAYQAAFHQQQQQQQIMHHQLQIMAAQNAQAMNSVKQQSPQMSTQTKTVVQDGNTQNMGHEGVVHGASIEELSAAWTEANRTDGDWQRRVIDEELETAWAETENNHEEDYLGFDGTANGASIEELAAAWAEAEAEYERLAETDSYDDDLANMYQGGTQTRPYEFINKVEEEENQPSQQRDWMDEGMRQFRSGNMKEAIRSFEMELQQRDPNNAAAWRMLGKCHAENDMDPEAIRCLEMAVDRDPYSPETLLALGSSYVNELDSQRALENMKAWFTHNPKYAGLELPTDLYGDGETMERTSAFEEVKQLLLSALAFDASDAGDVHEALGVVYNVIKDYEAAATSLRTALETRPDDYQLWNKLGATLANGSRSEEALPAYHRALAIKPKYARAWLNMAISHSNLNDHNEAARCYLQTLTLNPAAKHCWAYLRMSLSSAERWDLLPLCFGQDLKAFREHFDFVYEE